MAYQTPQNLDLYPIVEKKKDKSIDAKYQIQVGYWATRNHLQYYKIYVKVICMFDEDFFNNLLQPPQDNLWPAHSTNWNY
jgi:hypothetical protein